LHIKDQSGEKLDKKKSMKKNTQLNREQYAGRPSKRLGESNCGAIILQLLHPQGLISRKYQQETLKSERVD